MRTGIQQRCPTDGLGDLKPVLKSNLGIEELVGLGFTWEMGF